MFHFVRSPLPVLPPTISENGNNIPGIMQTTLNCKSLYYSSGFPCDFTVTVAELIPDGIEIGVDTNHAIAESASTFSSYKCI